MFADLLSAERLGDMGPFIDIKYFSKLFGHKFSENESSYFLPFR